MPVKTPRYQRARVGEQRAPGDVRPVTTRTVFGLGVGIVVLVVLATAAILWASDGTKTVTRATTNLPSGGQITYVATYAETVHLPGSQPVSATLSLNCSATCTDGDFTGYGGDFTVKVNGAKLSATTHPSCQTETLALEAELSLAVPAQLPQTLTGKLTRSSTCPGTDAGPSATLELRRTR